MKFPRMISKLKMDGQELSRFWIAPMTGRFRFLVAWDVLLGRLDVVEPDVLDEALGEISRLEAGRRMRV